MVNYSGTMKDVWNESPIGKRKKLLKASGLHPSFATVNYEDLSKRSGGHVVRELDALFSFWKNKRR
jgi:hypothetical protein